MDSTASLASSTVSSTFFFLRPLERREHEMLRPTLNRMARMYPQPEAGEIAGPDTADHRLHPVVSRRRSFRLHPQRLPRKIQLVVNHQERGPASSSYRGRAGPLRPAAQVHVRLRLGEHHRLPGHAPTPDQRHDSPCGETRTLFAPASAIDNQKPEIMRREFVLRVRDSPAPRSAIRNRALARPGRRSTDRPNYFFFSLSFFGAAPSSSFLPFLITSGSAVAGRRPRRGTVRCCRPQRDHVSDHSIGGLNSFTDPASVSSPARMFCADHQLA